MERDGRSALSPGLGWALVIPGGLVFVPLTALFIFPRSRSLESQFVRLIAVDLVGLLALVAGTRILKIRLRRMVLIVALVTVAFYVVVGSLLIYGFSQIEF